LALNIAGTHGKSAFFRTNFPHVLAPVTRFGAEKNPRVSDPEWISPVMGDIKWMKIA
jgi:hypothetical protein